MAKQFLMRIKDISFYTKFSLAPLFDSLQTKVIKIAPRSVIILLGAPLLVLLTTCSTTILETEKKEWSDKYDPNQWRAQFEKCREIFYTNYPEEIKRDEWSACMDEKEWGE